LLSRKFIVIDLLYRNAAKTRLPRVKKSKLHQKYTTTIELLYGASRIYKVFWRGGTGRGGIFVYKQNTILYITLYYSTHYNTICYKNKKTPYRFNTLASCSTPFTTLLKQQKNHVTCAKKTHIFHYLQRFDTLGAKKNR
jgi:hypothetical protein